MLFADFLAQPSLGWVKKWKLPHLRAESISHRQPKRNPDIAGSLSSVPAARAAPLSRARGFLLRNDTKLEIPGLCPSGRNWISLAASLFFTPPGFWWTAENIFWVVHVGDGARLVCSAQWRDFHCILSVSLKTLRQVRACPWHSLLSLDHNSCSDRITCSLQSGAGRNPGFFSSSKHGEEKGTAMVGFLWLTHCLCLSHSKFSQWQNHWSLGGDFFIWRIPGAHFVSNKIC